MSAYSRLDAYQLFLPTGWALVRGWGAKSSKYAKEVSSTSFFKARLLSIKLFHPFPRLNLGHTTTLKTHKPTKVKRTLSR